MRFLIDANPRTTKTSLHVSGFESVDVRDIGMTSASDAQIAEYARVHKLAILTRDLGFTNTRRYPPGSYAGIVVLSLQYDTKAQIVLNVLREFVQREDLIKQLPGSLAIVESGHVRFRTT